MSELRKDPTKGRWVLIRPPVAAPAGPTGKCPYCPGNEAMTPPEITAYRSEGLSPDGPGWTVRVVPEVDPHFGIDVELIREAVGLYDRVSPRGATEIIVESPAHEDAPASRPAAQWEQVLWMYGDRLRDLKRDLEIRDILVTRRYPAAGVGHPHSRIMATPIIFDAVRRRLRECREHYEYKRRCVYCDILRQELATGDRVVQATEHFVALVPYAARVPLETWILPRQHDAAYEESLTGSTVADLAELVGGLFRTLASGFGDPAFEMTLFTSPNESAKQLPGEWATLAEDFHWSIEVLPEPHRLSQVGGIYVNDTPPEQGARSLRAAWHPGEPTAGGA